MRVLAVLLFAVLCVLARQSSSSADNAELGELYKLDQLERAGPNVDWTVLYHHDLERRARVHTMLKEGKVMTGADYYRAAMVYQHGQNPDDYLLAHLLAVTAIGRGYTEARWLTAATMDRYLRSIWQPQVYGTQFTRSSDKEPWHHELMNQDLVSDAMRSALCVVSFKQQEQDLAKAGNKGTPARTSVEHCN